MQSDIKKSNLTLSVCVPNYNHAHYIEKSLRSAWEQSVTPLEILVLDDASTDASMSVLERLAEAQPLIRVLKNEENLGVIGSLNRLLIEAKGDIIHFLAADDFLLPGFYEKSMGLLNKYPSVGLSCSVTRFIDEGEEQEYDELDLDSRESFPEYCQGEDISNLPTGKLLFRGNTILIKRKALLEVGGYQPQLRWHTDWFVNCVIGIRYGVCFMPSPLAVYRVAADQYSKGSQRHMEQVEVMRELIRLLLKPEYKDVRSVFFQSNILLPFNIVLILEAVLGAPELLNDELRQYLYGMLKRVNAEVSEKIQISSEKHYTHLYNREYLSQRLKSFISKWKKEKSRVVVFGAGDHTQYLFKWTDLLQVNIVGIVDSIAWQNRESIWSYELRKPSEICAFNPDVVIISSAQWQDEMFDQIYEYVNEDVLVLKLYS